MGTVTIGIDVGQKHDPTAIAVAELHGAVHMGRWETRYPVRYLERLPLGTPYPQVAERLAQVAAGVWRQMHQEAVAAAAAARVAAGLPKLVTNVPQMAPTTDAVRVYVDATGVGQPVVDLLRVQGVRVQPVYFTHGDRRTVDERGQVSLGKGWLVSRLQALLQTGRLLLPQTPEARALAEELKVYEIKVDEDANEKYGAFRVGKHDDLVTALGLAVQDEAGQPFSAAVAGHRTIFDPSGPPLDGRRATSEPGELTIEEMRRRGWVR